MKQILILISFLFGFRYLDAQDMDSASVFPFKTGSQWTFRSRAGILTQAPLFDSILLTSNSSFFGCFKVVVKLRNRYGVVQYMDKCDTLLPIEYNEIVELSPECYFLRKNDLWTSYSILKWDNTKGKFIWGFEEIGRLDSIYSEDGIAYFWKNGKMGLKIGAFETFYSNYSCVRLFDKSKYNQGYQHRLSKEYVDIDEANNGSFTYLVSDGNHFGLVRRGKELVPCNAESIQPFNNLFCRFWNGKYWIYVRYKDGFKIDPKGGTVVFYRDNCWKVYSTDREKASLVVDGVPFQIKGFDDYFYLSKEYIAVRKTDKIGLLSRKGVALIQPIYEQIDLLGNGLFRVLKEGEWYLSNASGVLLTKIGYDFIGKTDRRFGGKIVFEIHKEGKIGILLTNGNELLKPVYSSVDIIDDYLLAKQNDVLTVLGSGGKKLAEKNYIGYRQKKGFLILYLDKSRKDLFSIQGKLNQSPFIQIADLGEVVKLYGEGQLEVLVLNQKRTVLEERQIYSSGSSFAVAKLPIDEHFSVSDYRTLSYLEEHQLSGFFGYRKTFETTHIMKPDFLECFDFGEFDWEIGIRAYERKLFTVPDGGKFASFFDFYIVDAESAEFFKDPVTYTTFFNAGNTYDVRSGSMIMAYSPDKGNFWLYPQKHQASEVKEINYSGINSFAYYLGGGYEYTSADDEFAVSNYEHLMKTNHACNLAPVDGEIAEVMNPKLYKKLVGGRWFVTEISSSSSPDKALQNRYYSEFSYLYEDNYSNPLFKARDNSGNWIWNYQKGDSTANASYTEIKPFNTLMLVKVNSKIGVCLTSREVLLEPVYDEVYFISWDLLMVRKDTEYGVIDFRGNWIISLK